MTSYQNTIQGRMLATLDSLIQPLWWDNSSRQTVASTPLNHSTSYCTSTIPYSSPVITDTPNLQPFLYPRIGGYIAWTNPYTWMNLAIYRHIYARPLHDSLVFSPRGKIVWLTAYTVLVPIFWNHHDIMSVGLWIQIRSSKTANSETANLCSFRQIE